MGVLAVLVIVCLRRIGKCIIKEVVSRKNAFAFFIGHIAKFSTCHETAFGKIAGKEGDVSALGKIDKKGRFHVKAVSAGQEDGGKEKPCLPRSLGREQHYRRIQDGHVFDSKRCMFKKRVSAVRYFCVGGSETPGRGFSILEFTGDNPPVFQVIGKFARFFYDLAFHVHVHILAGYNGIFKSACGFFQIDIAGLGFQLIRPYDDMQIAACLCLPQGNVIGHPVGFDFRQGSRLGNGVLL